MNKLSSTQAPLEFSGHHYIRQILTLSVLSTRQVIIKNIRSDHINPGLTDYEVNLLQLIEKVTNGCQVNISKTSIKLIFKPGIIDCNEGLLIEHSCNLGRNISYYLEVICILAVFGKTELNLHLEGNTDDLLDQSVDSFGRSFTYLMGQFGQTAGTFSIKVKKRGFAPLGGGLVTLRQMYAKKLEAISLIDEGKIKRMRGWVVSAKVAP